MQPATVRRNRKPGAVIRPVKTFAPAGPRRPSPGSAMFSELAWKEIARSLKLSAREVQIVREVFDDRTEFAIGANLGISPHTVHTHFERLHQKLGVPDRVELVLRIVQEFVALTIAPGAVLPSICANRAAGCCPLLNPRPRPTATRSSSSHS
jgi:DNA-binding CsgD family transcriptional regulator